MPRPALAAAAIALAASAPAAFAQYGRYNDDGHALDASPAVGSGGINLNRPDLTLNSANRFITGNVTGLGAFRGYSPISDPSAFQAGLGSAGLSVFERRGVSAGDVLAGRLAPNLPFFSREQTIVPTGGILSGRNLPGSSSPLGAYQVPNTGVAAALNPDLTLSPGDLRAQGQALSISPIDLTTAAPYSPYDRIIAASALSTTPYARAARSPLFGTDPRRFSTLSTTVSEEPPGSGEAGLLADRSPAAARVERILPPLRSSERMGPAELATALEPGGDHSIEPGVDRFKDFSAAVSAGGDESFLRERLRRRLTARLQQSKNPSLDALLKHMDEISVERVGVRPAASPTGVREPAPIGSALANQGSTPPPPPDWAKKLLEEKIPSLAGRGEDVMNVLLAHGEKQLAGGQYFQAADTFARAQRADPRNPLPYLARCHALTAAGEYVSAVADLKRGLERFPQVMALPLDLERLMGGKAICDQRRRDLEQLVARRDNVDLRFLLGYVQFFSGHEADGLGNLLAAARAAPADSIVARFPEMLTGGGSTRRAPESTPQATQPAYAR